VVGRVLRSADFQTVLSTPPRSRSAHFSVHHVTACPSVPQKPAKKALSNELSTGEGPSPLLLVDEFVDGTALAPAKSVPTGCWLGLVVPKRHAKRSVTRNLLKRQMREAMQLQASSLLPGLWVLRLKAPFDRKLFPSPASDPLRRLVREELLALLQRAAARR
jgi:ribonuclease P protein component